MTKPFRVIVAEHAARLFGYACGWLGWTPATARKASIHEIIAAMEARLECFDATVPGFAEAHGRSGTAQPGTPPTNEAGDLDRDAVADRIRKAFSIFTPRQLAGGAGT